MAWLSDAYFVTQAKLAVHFPLKEHILGCSQKCDTLVGSLTYEVQEDTCVDSIVFTNNEAVELHEHDTLTSLWNPFTYSL